MRDGAAIERRRGRAGRSVRFEPLRRTGRFVAVWALAVSFVALGGKVRAGEGLFFGPDDVAGLREKVQREPYSSMLQGVLADAEQARQRPYDYLHSGDDARFLAQAYALTGDEQWATAAKLTSLALVNDSANWANTSLRSLTRSQMGLGVAVAYDLCKDAWETSTNAYISTRLKEMGDSLMTSGGAGYNSRNNWRAVRYGGAGLCFLATDDPVDDSDIYRCFDEVSGYMRHVLTTEPDSLGWNAEGVHYTQYPARFWAPFSIAVNRWDSSLDLRDAAPGAGNMLSNQSRVAVKTTYGGPGFRAWTPDLGDGGPESRPQSSANLAFMVSDPAHLPALKWTYDNLMGHLDGQEWDREFAGALYGVLYYPEDVTAQNPAEVWGLTYHDPGIGMIMYRNRYQDENDIAAYHKPKVVHPRGCHTGPDANAVRIHGLGSNWIAGSARYYTEFDARGESTVFPYDPTVGDYLNERSTGVMVDQRFEADGSGFSVAVGSPVGATDHKRLFAVDYSGASGAEGLFVMRDTWDDPFGWWRVNTPDCNTIEYTDDGFVMIAPNGARMHYIILAGDVGAPRTGMFDRGYAMYVADTVVTQNQWIDYMSSDGQMLVLMLLMPDDRALPEITYTDSGLAQVIEVGGQVVTITGDSVMMQSWIPEPGALTLLALGGLGLLHRRRS